MTDPKDYIDPSFRKFFKNPLLEMNPMADLQRAIDEMNLQSADEEEMYYGTEDIPIPEDYYAVVDEDEEGEEIKK